MLKATSITLRCWVYCDDVRNIFCVEIPKDETVGDLKKIIQEKAPGFRDMATKDLRLYLIFIPVGDEDGLERLSLKDKSCLDPETKVSKLFPESNKGVEGWFIVVDGPNSDIILNYWVRGDNMDSVHSVRISSTNNVHGLMRAIQNKHIDIPDIAPYKASLPYGKDDTLEGVLGACTISSLGKPLRYLQELSDVFMPLPADNQLHFIIDSVMTLECWLRGADLKSSFLVKISTCAVVNELKDAIKVAYSEDSDIKLPYTILGFYKIPIGDNVELQEILGTLGSGQLLWGVETLRDVFCDVPFSRVPRVVVEPLYKSLNGAVTTEPPQLDSQRSTFTRCGRLCEHEDTICTTLLYPVFGQFVDDCRTIEVTAVDNWLVEGLANTMSAVYNNELERVKAVARQFRNHNIYFGTIYKTGTGYVTDASDVSANGHCYVIAEFTSERDMSTEPYFQAIGYYVDSTRESAVKIKRSTLPCLLLNIFGPHIVFAGVVWNSRPTVQALSMPIPFQIHSTDIRNRHNAARHVAALRKATEGLKKYYANLQERPLPTSAPDLPHLFPYPTSYRSLHDNTLEKSFQYVLHWRKLIFFGTEGKDDHICIKFVRTYSSDAHKFLASLGCAPALRGFEKIADDWFMVVMDRIPSVDRVMSSDWATLIGHWKSLRASVFADISAKLGLFHEAGYVHGNICDGNIMLSSSDKRRFMIVGLDWAGRTGEARYPARVNQMDMVRPPGACDGRVILAEDDVFMLDRII